MNNDIFKKLTELRDKYPENSKLICELLIVAFTNNGSIPLDNFSINGFYNYEDLSKIFAELSLPEKFSKNNIMNSSYSRMPKTEIAFINNK